MKKINLNEIYIRARMNGNWKSVSLMEIFKSNDGGAWRDMQNWFVYKILSLAGLAEGTPIKQEHLEKAIELLEKNGIKIAKLK